MFTDRFKHDINSYMTDQAKNLLSEQAVVNNGIYRKRSGRLSEAFMQNVQASEMRVEVPYPKYIRFLDMKKTGKGVRKKRYAPIYNKYVYGYLKSDIWRMLMAAIPKRMIRTIEETVSSVK